MVCCYVSLTETGNTTVIWSFIKIIRGIFQYTYQISCRPWSNAPKLQIKWGKIAPQYIYNFPWPCPWDMVYTLPEMIPETFRHRLANHKENILGVIKKLIRKHRVLFFTAVFLTFLSVFLNLCWNKFLMELLDGLGDSAVFPAQRGMASWFWTRVGWIVLLHTISEFASTGLASCVCERFAHDLRMGYVR